MLTIEKARRDDARAAFDIRNAAILDQCTEFYPNDILKIWTEGELSDEFTDEVEKYFYIAKYNGKTIGTGAIDLETGKIDAIFVHPTYMRKGIGKNIVSYLEDIALKSDLELLALESTLNAAVFYRACGFEGNKISTYVSPRGISMDCVPMTKSISPNKSLQPYAAKSRG